LKKINAEVFFLSIKLSDSQNPSSNLYSEHRSFSSADFDPENANRKLPVILKNHIENHPRILKNILLKYEDEFRRDWVYAHTQNNLHKHD
jgi:hypothetical protein